jgi:hypothetical protein
MVGNTRALILLLCGIPGSFLGALLMLLSPSYAAGLRADGVALSVSLVGRWELQDINGPDCAPPLGLSDSDRARGIVKRVITFEKGGTLKQRDVISPNPPGRQPSFIEAKYAINGDRINIRWRPEDQNVDTYEIVGLTNKSVTLTNASTCRYMRAG